MMVLWVTLLVLHQAYALLREVPVGETVTISCALPSDKLAKREMDWYKQSQGDTLTLIASVTQVHKKDPHTKYTPEFKSSGWKINNNKNFSNLTIMRTTEEDEGIYHCMTKDWTSGQIWRGTHLMLKGKSKKKSNFTVVQRPTASDPVHPGDSVTLQCSVLFDSEDRTCPGDLSVFWFRAGSDKSHPQIISTNAHSPDYCEKRSEPQSCACHFSNNITFSNEWSYYCAVATCGKIVFGDEAQLGNEERNSSEFIAIVAAGICLVISVIVNIVFICSELRTPKAAVEQFEGRDHMPPQRKHDNAEGRNDLNYASLHFSEGKAKRGRKTKELNTEDSLYSQVKC